MIKTNEYLKTLTPELVKKNQSKMDACISKDKQGYYYFLGKFSETMSIQEAIDETYKVMFEEVELCK